MRTEPKPCKYCEGTNHYPYQCWKNPYLKKYGWKGSLNYKTYTKVVPKRRSKAIKLWRITRRQWFIDHAQESYECYLCGKYLTPIETTLDHVKPRSGNPSLRYEHENLQPCCWSCNTQKGSMSLEQYRIKYGSNTEEPESSTEGNSYQ